MNAIIYCRISRKKNSPGFSLDAQEQICRSLAFRNNLSVIYVSKETQSAYYNKKRDIHTIIENHTSIYIIMKCVDRFSRNVQDATKLIQLAFKNKNTLVFVQEKISCQNNKMANLILKHVLKAQNESLKLSKRLKDIHQHKKSLGLHIGGKVPYGFEIKKTSIGLKRFKNKYEQNVLSLINYLKLDEQQKKISKINDMFSLLVQMDNPIVFYDADSTESKYLDGYMSNRDISDLLNLHSITYRGVKWKTNNINYLYKKNLHMNIEPQMETDDIPSDLISEFQQFLKIKQDKKE